jgi:hypothetical protein
VTDEEVGVVMPAMTCGQLKEALDDYAKEAAAETGCEPNDVKVVGWVSETDEWPDTYGISHVEHATLHDRTDTIAVVFRGTVDWETMLVDESDWEVAS